MTSAVRLTRAMSIRAVEATPCSDAALQTFTPQTLLSKKPEKVCSPFIGLDPELTPQKLATD